jgi:MYXO-CTERM domain-containing protein
VGGALVVAGYVLALVAIGFRVPLSGYFLVVPWLGDLSGALHGCEVASGAPDAGPRRLAPLIALAAIVALSALTRGPLLSVLAGGESVTWCDYQERCEGGDRDECLLHAANFGPLLPEPACFACIARHQACDEVQRECAAQCWPEAPARTWLYDPPLGL